MPYAIESGIPIPPKRTMNTGAHGDLVAVLKRCMIGDSVLVTDPNVVSNVQSRMYSAHGMSFTRRQVEGGIRMWRIA